MTAIPKSKRLISKKITNSAKGEICELRTQFCNRNPETTVFCHAPSDDDGMGIKSPDWWGAYGCSNCHDYVDGKPVKGYRYTPAGGKWRQFDWAPPIYRTQKKLIQKKLIEVK